jgi:GTP-binding protein EngB required for normal cell division
MPKTMKQMKAIVKQYLKERVRLKRVVAVADQAASVAQLVTAPVMQQQAAIAAHQAAIVVQQQNAIAAHQAALNHANSLIVQHQAALQAQHDQALQDHAYDDEWMIAFEYENEEWESDV